MSLLADQDKDRFLRAIKDVRGVSPIDKEQLASGLVAVGKRLPSPWKAGLVGAVVGVAGGALFGKDALKSGLLWGGMFFVGTLMVDSATIGGYTLGFGAARGRREREQGGKTK